MPETKNVHWGRWMLARSEVVGFHRQEDLARAVGCTRERIGRWAAMPLPPRQLRKGFDEALARELQTTRDMLFKKYATTPPDVAPRERWGFPSLEGARPWDSENFRQLDDYKKLSYLAMFIGPEDRKAFLSLFIQIANARIAEQLRQQENEILDGSSPYDDKPHRPPLPREMTKDAILARRAKGKPKK